MRSHGAVGADLIRSQEGGRACVEPLAAYWQHMQSTPSRWASGFRSWTTYSDSLGNAWELRWAAAEAQQDIGKCLDAMLLIFKDEPNCKRSVNRAKSVWFTKTKSDEVLDRINQEVGANICIVVHEFWLHPVSVFPFSFTGLRHPCLRQCIAQWHFRGLK